MNKKTHISRPPMNLINTVVIVKNRINIYKQLSDFFDKTLLHFAANNFF